MTALAVANVKTRDVATDDVLVDVIADWPAARERWNNLAARGVAGLFQQTAWLDAWFATIGKQPGVTPAIVFLRSPDRGDVAALSLVRRQAGDLSVIEFADDAVTDYAAPILARDVDASVVGDAWRKIRAALPPADIIHLQKMPVEIGGKPNALALGAASFPCPAAGHVLNIPGEWEDWRKSLARSYRKETDRFLRVFQRHEGARFERITDVERARVAYDALQTIQRERMKGRVDYTLDEPAKAQFYWNLIRDNLASGYVVLTALSVGDDFAGLLLGVTCGQTYAMLRLAPASGQWSNCAPGRLLIERTMNALHADGYRMFDFTIGSYDYKRRFGAVPTPLRDMAQTRSLRGAPFVLNQRLRGLLRAHPELKGVIDKFRGKKGQGESADGDA